MPNFRKLAAYAAAFVGLAAGAVIVSDALAESHQNVEHGHPQQCAAIQSGTPGYRDCMANHAPPKTAIVTRNTQLKAEPNSSSRAISVLNEGTQVGLVEPTANGFWFHVKSGGLEGYVSHELIDVREGI
jgi:hypothetical protein